MLDRQYEGFLQVAARIAQIHEKADHLRNMYLHMSMEETSYATGAQQSNAGNRGTGVTNASAAGYTTSKRMKDPFRDADLKQKQLKANETRRVERRKKILYQRNMMGGALNNGLVGNGTTANGGINGGGAGFGSLVGNNTGLGGNSNTLALGNGTTGGGLFGQGTSGSSGGLFNNSNKPSGGTGLFGGAVWGRIPAPIKVAGCLAHRRQNPLLAVVCLAVGAQVIRLAGQQGDFSVVHRHL